MSIKYIKVTASRFVGSLLIEDGRCVNSSTVLAYMLGWSEERVRKHLKRKRWSAEEMGEEDFAKAVGG